jgi:prevent-host-death family protein
MRISVSEAKAQLTDLVRRAEAGEEVVLTRRGKPAARLVPPAPQKQWEPVDPAIFEKLDKIMPAQKESAGDFIRRMRDDARY